MSKKKDNDSDMVKMMAEILNNIATGDPDEVSSFLDNLQDRALELNNMRFYRYQRPDYLDGIDTKLPKWLLPMWNADDEVDIVKLCKSIDNAGKTLTKEQKEADIHKYMMNLFGRFNKDEDSSHWRLYGIFWLMEEYGISDIRLVLETMKQDAWFIEHYTSGLEDVMANVLYQHAGNNLKPLKNFLYAQGYVPDSKRIVFAAIVTRIGQHPEERLSIVSLLTEFLKHCYDICMQGAYPGNLCHYIETLALANVHEAMPIIRKIINDIDNVMFETGESEYDIECEMKTVHPKIKAETLTMDYLINTWGKNDNEGDNYLMDSFGSLFNSDEPDEEEPESQLYSANNKMRKYTISVHWANYDNYDIGGVGVLLTVPSNIYLTQLAKLIMLAFGRNDVPPYNFEDMPGDNYLDSEGKVAKVFDKHDNDYEDITEVKLSDILTKNDNMIRLYTDPYSATERAYNISLRKLGDYGKNTTQFVRLEDAYGPSPAKRYKTAGELYAAVNTGKAKAPDMKKLRESIKEWYDSVK